MGERKPGEPAVDGLDALRARIRALEGNGGFGRGTFGPASGRVALGLAAVDDVLGGGLAFGRVHEMAGPAAVGFAVAVLAGPGAEEGTVLWCRDAHRSDPVYPPGLAALGLDPGRVLFAACRGAETLWAMEEGLASGAVAAVVGEMGRRVDLTASRRLQLAAEKGGALGVVLPPGSGVFGSMPPSGGGALAPNALSTRWRVAPVSFGAERRRFFGAAAARWRLELKRQRGGDQGGGGTGQWIVEWTAHGAARGFSLVSQAGDGQAPPRLAEGSG